jgi:hypothetical protein
MSSIVDYASLNTAVAAWMHRTGDTAFAAIVPDAIGLVEGLISAKLKSRSMETRASLSTVAGTAYVALPTDLVEARRLIITSTDPQAVLKYVTPDEMTRLSPYSTTGQPSLWTVIGANLQLGVIPDGVYTLELSYLQKIPALTASNTTNWLLTAFPNVYLFGTLAQMCIFTEYDEGAKKYVELFNAGIDAINAMDWYSGSTMNVRAA